MANGLFWVNKDTKSEKLSRSLGRADTEIRRHAQMARRSQKETKHQTDDPTCKANCFEAQKASCMAWSCHLLHASPVKQLSHARQRLFNLSAHTSLDLTSEERRGLHFFATTTAGSWSGWQDRVFWTYTVSHVCQDHAGIAHGLISLASLHESRLCNDSAQSQRLLTFSLMQRDKAVRSSIVPEKRSYYVSVVSCLVLICVQNAHHGHHSFQLLHAADHLLREWEAAITSGVATHPEEVSTAVLMRLFIGRLQARICLMIEPLQALRGALDYNRKTDEHVKNESGPAIPESFSTLLEARNKLEDIFDWLVYLRTRSDASIAEQMSSSIIGSWRQGLEALDRSGSGSRSGVFEASFETTRALLDAAGLYGAILFETLTQQSELIFDRHHDTFEQILCLVRHAQEGAGEPHGHTSFGIDDGVLDILAFVSLKCRHPALRREAIAMLLNSGRIEGGRLSWSAGIIAQKLMDVEEQGIVAITSAGDISEHQRVRMIKGEQYFSQRKIRLTTTRPGRSSQAHEVITEQYWVDLPKEIDVLDPEVGKGWSDVPDTIFECGRVRFLLNRDTKEYGTIEGRQFFFPIPRA